MIVSHIIDWKYIRRLVSDQATDRGSLGLLRHQLWAMRKSICRGGLLIVDDGNDALRDLVGVISDLRQDGEGQLITEWIDLSKELENYQQLYRNCSLRIGDFQVLAISDVSSSFSKFLHTARLDVYELPRIVVTDNWNLDVHPGVVVSTIEGYDDAFASVCWQDVETFDSSREEGFKRYMAGVSLAASCFHEVVFQDPYLSFAFDLSRGPATNMDGRRWQESLKKIMRPCITNPYVKVITMVSAVDTFAGKGCKMLWLKNWLTGRNARSANASLRVVFHFCNVNRVHLDRDNFHDRHIFIAEALPGCLFPRGFDICNENGQLCREIRFSVNRIKFGVDAGNGGEHVYYTVMKMKRHSHSDALRFANINGSPFSCDIENWKTECRPQVDAGSTFELSVQTSICSCTTEGEVE